MNNEDAISRAQAKAALMWNTEGKNALLYVYEAQDRIEALPSVPPQIVHGRWINPHWRNSVSCADCSVCQKEAQHRDYRGVQKYYNLCPSCGAKMDGGEEDAVD